MLYIYIHTHTLLLFSRSVMSDSLQPQGLQHARLPCPLPSPRACPNSCPLSQWCRPTISSSVPFSSCLQIFPRIRAFLMSQLFTSCGQSIGASFSASVLPMNIQDWLVWSPCTQTHTHTHTKPSTLISLYTDTHTHTHTHTHNHLLPEKGWNNAVWWNWKLKNP